VQENVYRLQVSCEGSGATIEMDAFPDTPLATIILDPEQCTFIVLTASVVSHDTRAPQSTQYAPPKALQTYSGIVLLLTTHSAWFARQKQLYHEYKSTLASVEPSRGQQWRLNAFETLMLQQQKKTMKTDGETETIYQTVGALQFRDLNEQAYRSLTSSQRLRNIWLE
jgi:hypothetical protein